MKFILASASPRRKHLLSQAKIPYEVYVPDVDETMEIGLNCEEIVKELARKKARAALSNIAEQHAIIIGADTVVYLNNEILTKPFDQKEAFNMLKKLSGNTHEVHTGQCVLKKCGAEITENTMHTSARVTIKRLTDYEINEYIKTKEPFDKAGSYAIQGLFSLFIENIAGDYCAVVGLSVSCLYEQLKAQSINIFEYWG